MKMQSRAHRSLRTVVLPGKTSRGKESEKEQSDKEWKKKIKKLHNYYL